ncbi:hypothetical protein BC1002_5377 [Paraburkholderia atlantica]|uniref:Uncharacterized protein n=1 Tax=Paraburkholderia atlantica TaxID=2654982 RepID=D5WFF7_PARAM|nr:hypothetical protein BC1002_5377 [Paraburkholderia atlantica]
MSLGCIGLLKEILDEAVDLAIDEEIERITADILERGNLRLMQRETLAKELLDGFRLIEGRDHPDRTLFEHASSSETNRRKCRPGTRSPTRDAIWSIRWIKICQRHQCRLSNHCPTCGYQRRFEISSRQLCGYCSRCQGWLGAEKAESLPARLTAEQHYEAWAAECVANLLANHPPTTTADGRRSISKVIDRGIRRFFDGNAAAFCEHIGVSKSSPRYWRDAGPPQANTLIDISYCLQVPCVSWSWESTISNAAAPSRFPPDTLAGTPAPIPDRGTGKKSGSS